MADLCCRLPAAGYNLTSCTASLFRCDGPIQLRLELHPMLESFEINQQVFRRLIALLLVLV